MALAKRGCGRSGAWTEPESRAAMWGNRELRTAGGRTAPLLARIWEKRTQPNLGQLSFATGFAGWPRMLLS